MAERQLGAKDLQTVLERRHSATVVIAGGNSSVAKVEALGEVFAVKRYGGGSDPLGRLRRECLCVAATSRHSFPGFAELRGVNEPDLLAVYTWIEGSRPVMGSAFVASALTFLERLHMLSLDCPWGHFPEAVDAVFEPQQLLRQIRSRANGLADSAVPEVADFASGHLLPAAQSVAEVPGTHDCGQVTLSPSDFGPHNVICGSAPHDVTCIDLEFFGWDDATKLICDSLLHPLTEWTPDLAGAFLDGGSRIYGLSRERVLRHSRWYALKWAAIVARRAEGMLAQGHAGGGDVLRLASAYLQFGLQRPGGTVDFVHEVVALRHGRDRH